MVETSIASATCSTVIRASVRMARNNAPSSRRRTVGLRAPATRALLPVRVVGVTAGSVPLARIGEYAVGTCVHRGLCNWHLPTALAKATIEAETQSILKRLARCDAN